MVNIFVEEIVGQKPDIVGFTIRPGSRLFSNFIAKQIKSISPRTFIIYGVVLKVQLDLVELPFVDAISRGEADVTFPHFLRSYVKNRSAEATPGFTVRNDSGRVVAGEATMSPPKLENIPFADFTYFDFNKYLKPNTIPMMFSRGCINKCSFCSAFGQYFRYRSNDPKNIVEQIQHYIAKSNVNKPYHVHATDQLINGNLKSLKQLAVQIADLPVKVTWQGMASLRSDMTDSYIRALAKGGLSSVFFGLESASQHVLNLMKKNTDLIETERIIKTFWRCGIYVHCSIVVGHPGETEEEFNKTFDFLVRMRKFMSGFTAAPLWLGDKHSDIYQHTEKYDVKLTHPMNWTADNGRNTYEIRLKRTEKLQKLSQETGWKAITKETFENRLKFKYPILKRCKSALVILIIMRKTKNFIKSTVKNLINI